MSSTTSTRAPPPPYTETPAPPTRATPLPSYTSSPVLRTTVPASEALPLKLCPPPTAPTPASVTHSVMRVCIALLGPTLVDLVYLTLLNVAGVLLTLAQLPLAVVLALQFSGFGLGEGRFGGKQKGDGWVMHVTQVMWDCHDWLKEAELEVPSCWARAQ
ncbi:conserved hypothetical protein [Sporisorium reilianum SRZ2]|uniref:Uncharacterized protein n=1 Tax=Sporisorium reilianum (strain SRZ2) TaxID=999809 RepID=E6ZMH6_SPORE|nr:conserved hypothetical protein [Sporisorium reilianum SRZ2]